MFKKRGLKGTARVKVVRRASESSGSDSDGEGETVVKKKAKVVEKSIDNVATDEVHTLTRNEEATKVDTLHQELIEKERKAKMHTPEEVAVDGEYKGQKAYANFMPTKSKSTMDKIGPKKTSSNIRSTTVFDFARDECKDYKQTGFCGYGDSCKFVHHRDDFKAGWKLNTDWDLAKQDDKAKELEGIPFKCVICKDDYTSPIKTKCGHYFCENCFLQRCKTATSCIICGKDTERVALPAKNLKQLIHTLRAP